jgi:hypothetical protein
MAWYLVKRRNNFTLTFILPRKDRRKPRRSEVKIDGVSFEIQTGHLPNTRHKCYQLSFFSLYLAFCFYSQHLWQMAVKFHTFIE